MERLLGPVQEDEKLGSVEPHRHVLGALTEQPVVAVEGRPILALFDEALRFLAQPRRALLLFDLAGGDLQPNRSGECPRHALALGERLRIRGPQRGHVRKRGRDHVGLVQRDPRDRCEEPQDLAAGRVFLEPRQSIRGGPVAGFDDFLLRGDGRRAAGEALFLRGELLCPQADERLGLRLCAIQGAAHLLELGPHGGLRRRLLGLRFGLRLWFGNRTRLGQRKRGFGPRDRVGGKRLRGRKRHSLLLRFDLIGRRWRWSFDRRTAFRGDLGNRWRSDGRNLKAKVLEGRERLLALFDFRVHSRFRGDGRLEDASPQSVFGGQVRRRPLAGPQVAAQRCEGRPDFGVAGRGPPGVPQERVEDFGIANAHRRAGICIKMEKPNEANCVLRRWLARRRSPLNVRQVRAEDRHLPGPGEIQERRPGQKRRIQPEGAIRDEEIDARRAEKIATRGAASNAARGEHTRIKGGGSYKSWAVSGGRSQTAAEAQRQREADMFIATGRRAARRVPRWTSGCDRRIAKTTR